MNMSVFTVLPGNLKMDGNAVRKSENEGDLKFYINPKKQV